MDEGEGPGMRQCQCAMDAGVRCREIHDVAFHYPRWTIALWSIISNTYKAFKCTQTHHTTA
eukprot:3205617-Prymnesium_polylepis.1